MTIKNKKGFTLVELLAVIVVLAIVMLIGIQNVLPLVDESRRKSVALDAQTAIDAAQTYFMSASLNGKDALPTASSPTKCVTISWLRQNGLDIKDSNVDNSGYVTVRYKDSSSGGTTYLYAVTYKKGVYWVKDKGNNGTVNDNISLDDVKKFEDGDSIETPSGCTNG